MANKLYEENDIRAIANAIRAKSGTDETYKPSEMAEAIEAIPTGGSLKALLDATKSTRNLFYKYNGNSVEGLYQFADTSNVKDMVMMFNSCSYLVTIQPFDSSNATSMSGAFGGCLSLLYIPPLDTSNVISYCDQMFYECRKLTEIDLSKMNIRNTSYSGNMFVNCYSLKKVIIRAGANSNGKTVPVLNPNAFNGCYHLTGTVNSTYNPTGAKDCFIYVPDDMVDAWKSATNWSVYASQIKGLSELPQEE